MKVALTHDVDRTKKSYQYLTYLIKSIKRVDIKSFKYHFHSFVSTVNPYWNFDEIIKIENEFGVRSTFFFLNETIKFNPFRISNWQLSLGRYDILEPKIIEIIKYLDKNGWEVGLHGSYNSFNNKLLLDRGKEILEKILGHKIIGTRQHYLNWNNKTWKIQKDIGLKYDSTWGFTDNIGFKEGKITPFRPFNDDFVVFPLAIMDVCYMSIEESKRWKKFLRIFEEVEKNDGILVLNWHQRVFNEKEFPKYKNEYIKIISYLRNNNTRFDTLGNYYKQIIRSKS